MARPLLARRRKPTPTQQPSFSLPRSVTASARTITIGDRTEAKRLRRQRAPWQSEAWAYRRNLGELRYAVAYQGNSAMRMRFFPATYVLGEQLPVSVDDVDGLPPDLIAAAHDAMRRLASGGPMALAALQKKLTENFQVAGECYLVGQVDPDTTIERWDVKSVSEVHFEDSGKVFIKDSPDASGKDDMEELTEWDYIARLWWPDPEWGQLPDSPFRAVLDICEELLLLGKDVRATARSRLANNGVLLVPDTLSVVRTTGGENSGQDDDDEDPFFAELLATATASITNEGAASAVVPIIIKGPAQALEQVRHITIERKNNDKGIEQRTELIGRLATGLDLPAEVLTGKVDLNHWTAWQVDDDAFRHHIEPIVIVECDALTQGFLWPVLDAAGFPPEQVRRVLVWYDPTELVTKPDRSTDAYQAWDRGALSDEALRRYLGFPDTDKPSDQEILLRMATHVRSLDPAIQTAILRILDPSIPDPVGGGPAGGGGAPADQTPAPAPSTQPGTPATDQPGTGDAQDGAASSNGHKPVAPGPMAPMNGGHGPFSPEYTADLLAGTIMRIATQSQTQNESGVQTSVTIQTPAVTASSARSTDHTRLSRQLLDIDRNLKTQLQTAANAAMKRALEKAGAKVVSKARTASAGTPVKEIIKGVPAAAVPARCGKALLAAMGLHERNLLDTEFAELQKQWDKWVTDAQREAQRVAAKLTGKPDVHAEAALTSAQERARNDGWNWFQQQLDAQAVGYLSGMDDEDEVDLDTKDWVTAGLVRAAVGIAGGFLSNSSTAGIGDNGRPVDPSEVLGGIGTGTDISNYLTDNGATQDNYQWVHGPSSNPFEPHLELDGTTFENFDDPSLANDGDFPSYAYFTPGDHDGCLCDFLPLWVGAEAQEDQAA